MIILNFIITVFIKCSQFESFTILNFILCRIIQNFFHHQSFNFKQFLVAAQPSQATINGTKLNKYKLQTFRNNSHCQGYHQPLPSHYAGMNGLWGSNICGGVGARRGEGVYLLWMIMSLPRPCEERSNMCDTPGMLQ